MALFGPSVVTQVQRPDPRAGGATGVARPKPGPGRGAGPERRNLTPARMAASCPQAPSGLSPGMQPAAFTPTQKAASGRLDHPRVALFGPSVVTQVQQPDPLAIGARGVAKHKPGPGRGAGPCVWGYDPRQNGCWGPQARSGLSPGMQPAAFTPTQEGCFGEAGPPTPGPIRA